jgi:hypothetical protein
MEKKNQRNLEDKCLSTYGEAEDVKWAKGPYCLFLFYFSLTALWPNPSFSQKNLDWMMPLNHISGAAYYRLCALLCKFWACNIHLVSITGPKCAQFL